MAAFNVKLIKTRKEEFGKNKELDGKFSSYYSNLKQEKAVQLYFNVFFILERILFSAALVFLTEFPLMQIISLVCLQVSIISFQLKFDPFKDKLEKIILLINDFCVLFCSILLFGFYFAPEFSIVRIILAWLFVVLVLLTVGLNIIISMSVSVKAFCLKLR